jgi:CDP-diacylglycerol--glycerol-3-phosphate 3-phosphatidyltransferase
MTWANRVTLARLGLTIVYFGLLFAAGFDGERPPVSPWREAALACLLVALLTDWLDGWLARRLGQVTQFGRIADPFVDKIVICGSLVFFAAFVRTAALVPAWVVVVVIAREFLVHGLRSAAEAQGVAFGATFWGKQKMFFQSAAVVACAIHAGWLSDAAWSAAVVRSLVAVMLVSTVASGVAYAMDALRAAAMRAG